MLVYDKSPKMAGGAPDRRLGRTHLELLNPEYVASLMNTDMELRQLFEGIIGAPAIIASRRRISSTAIVGAPVNAEISVFYRYFISKCYFNLISKNARSELLENYASIFPFQVDSSVQIDNVPILDSFDEKFLEDIRQFIDHHIVDSDFSDLEFMLVKNIESFRRKYFSSQLPMQYIQLKAIAEIGSRGVEEQEEPVEFVCDYMRSVYHLTEAGVDWYMNFQTALNEVNAEYNKPLISTRARSHFKHLMEINCCELLLLLEHRFYSDERKKYEYLFQKYVFFFGHAVDFANEAHHPVFFIDDVLFECLKSLRTYQFSDTHAMQLEYDVWMMALVHLRRYTPSRGPIERRVDRCHLQRAVSYVTENFSDNTQLYYENSLLYPIRHRNFFLGGDTVFRLTFVDVEQFEPRHFYELILKAALLDQYVQNIVIYNVYNDLQVTMNMPPVRSELRKLISAMHMKIVPVLRAGCRLKDVISACQTREYVVPEQDEMPTRETFLVQGKDECFLAPSA